MCIRDSSISTSLVRACVGVATYLLLYNWRVFKYCTPVWLICLFRREYQQTCYAKGNTEIYSLWCSHVKLQCTYDIHYEMRILACFGIQPRCHMVDATQRDTWTLRACLIKCQHPNSNSKPKGSKIKGKSNEVEKGEYYKIILIMLLECSKPKYIFLHSPILYFAGTFLKIT